MAYTRHGHHILGTTILEHERPNEVARCGGPGFCEECSREAYTQYSYAVKNTPSLFSSDSTQAAKTEESFDVHTMLEVYDTLIEVGVEGRVARQAVDKMKKKGLLLTKIKT